jgi:uncharacterized protein YndB with AHSA1/START domain
VHEFDAREGGSFRISLTYDAPTGSGKSAAHTDTYHGRFVKLVPGEQVVEVLEFETADPGLRGEMTITTTLTEAGGGTDVVVRHEGIPDQVPGADNETGTRMALTNLAGLLERGPSNGYPCTELHRMEAGSPTARRSWPPSRPASRPRPVAGHRRAESRGGSCRRKRSPLLPGCYIPAPCQVLAAELHSPQSPAMQ